MGFYDHDIAQPYTKTAFIDNLDLYTANAGRDALLDISRELVTSENFYFMGIPFPSSANISFAPFATFGGDIQIPSLCFLTNLTGHSFTREAVGSPTNIGFQISIYDKGAKLDVGINSRFLRGNLTASNMVPVLPQNPLTNASIIGQAWLQSPMVVLQPGSLSVEITNLTGPGTGVSPANSFIQVLFALAVPINAQSISKVQNKGTYVGGLTS